MEAVRLVLSMVLQGAVAFRAASAVTDLLRPWLCQLPGAPVPNTTEAWLLRLGLFELQRPKERADDWIFLIDHTLQLGAWKCLVVVGVRQSEWARLERPLAHHDLTLLALEPVRHSDGAQVCRQLEAAAEQTGPPLAILADEGSDLANGMAQFRAHHAATGLLNDVAHKGAIFLKRELLADPRWEAFVQKCGQTQPRVKQTELGHLAPPAQKVKARYMNLGPLVEWGVKMLRLVETPPDRRPSPADLSRLDEKFGWIRDFREALPEWSDLEAVKECALEYGRIEGYHAGADEQLRARLAECARTMPGRRLAEAFVTFFQEQSGRAPHGRSLPASSEVLESLIGKGKRLQGQHSRGGFTKLILGMAASVVELTDNRIQEALETVRHSDLTAWCQQKLGPSLTAQRRQALPAIMGTKTG